MFLIPMKKIINNTFKKVINVHDQIIMSQNRPYMKSVRGKRKSEKYKNDGLAYLQVLGTGAKGATKSLYFFTTNLRYIFNVGESTQRIANEHKVKVSELEHVFITNPTWENIGGLPGLALTIQDAGQYNMCLHGPDGLESLFGATDRFVGLNGLKISMASCTKKNPYDDSFVTIDYVPLKSEFPTMLSEKKYDYADKDDVHYYYNDSKKKETLVKNVPKVYGENDRLSMISMAYICRMKPKLGKLNIEACVDRNVPIGPLLQKLKSGEDITLEDGSIVKSDDVKEPDVPGLIFIVIDCPDEHFLQSLISETAFNKYQQENNDQEILKYVIHFTPSVVMQTEKYKLWMSCFPKTTMHVNVNDSNECLGSISCLENQIKLNLLDKDIFPLLKRDGVCIIESQFPKTEEEEIEMILQRARNAANNVEHNYRRDQFNFTDEISNTLRCLPLSGSIPTNIPDIVCLDIEKKISEVKLHKEYNREMKWLKTKILNLPKSHYKNHFPRITFLGTGSSIPTKYRNVSGILVSLRNDCHMFLDCGEGTYSQLVRHFGYTKTRDILLNTKLIFISHMHADHHLGLFNILKHRTAAFQELKIPFIDVLVIAPNTFDTWIRRYESIFENITRGMVLIPNDDLVYKRKNEYQHDKILSSTNLKDFTTAYVHHCPHSFGISFIDSNDIKITYSGDTKPCQELINIGKKSNLLIHEATFENELESEANAKMHSTFKQAIEQGQKMQSDFTLLTHFSQRYTKVPVLDDICEDNVGIAFDHMEVSMKDLPKLSLFNNMYKIIYREEFENMENRRFKRKKRESILAIDS